MSPAIAPAFYSPDKKMNYVFAETKILLSPDELTTHIQRCTLNDRDSQKKIYTTFYSFSMRICRQYTNNQDDAVEILNDGFLKIFREIHRYSPAYTDVMGSFKGWLRKVMVRVAIDHFRKNKKHRFTTDVDNGIIQLSDTSEDALDRISYQEILRSIQELSPVYKTVLSLYILEGRKHQEISTQLGISIGASKSNLAKARAQLQKILFQRNHIEFKKRQSDFDSDKIMKPRKDPKMQEEITSLTPGHFLIKNC
jgi:RNA polymerase sigma factor (sigma-70 family)